MSVMGVDIAWARPDSSQIRAQGAHFVARYLSPDSSKNLTASEVKSYPADGLSIVVVWESTADRMLGGYAAGHADAQAAEVQRAAVGLPSDMPIYFACDFDAQGSQYHTVNEYLRGVNDVIGLNRTGVYAGYYVVENVASAPARAAWFWQADAWSNGNWSSHANIRQDGGTLLAGSADVDHAMTTDYGQFPRPNSAPSPAPSTNGGSDLPTPQDVWAYKNPATGEDAWGHLGDTHRLVNDLHKALVEQILKSGVDGAEHSLGEHEVATNANVIQLRQEFEALKSLVVAIAKKVGA